MTKSMKVSKKLTVKNKIFKPLFILIDDVLTQIGFSFCS